MPSSPVMKRPSTNEASDIGIGNCSGSSTRRGGADSAINNKHPTGNSAVVARTAPPPHQSLSSNDSTDSNDPQHQQHQRRLEEASAVCARGRQFWTRDQNAAAALSEFEHALKLLETLLGTYHSLTAKTYYWLGFIRKHDPTQYDQALQAFVQTARIRLVLLGSSHESTQEAISAIRWVLVHQQKQQQKKGQGNDRGKQPSSGDADSIKAYLSNLYESIRLEKLGDARLRHRGYAQALDYYQQSMTTFKDSKHATIMGKRAFGAFKQGHLDAALRWYRQALLVFTTQTVHGLNHPDVPTTLERMEQVLQAYQQDLHGRSYKEDNKIALYLSNDGVLTSVQEQWMGQCQLNGGNVVQAQHHFMASLELESNILGDAHEVVSTVLQSWVNTTTQLLEETNLSQRLEECQKTTLELKHQLLAAQTVAAAPRDVKEYVKISEEKGEQRGPTASTNALQWQRQLESLRQENIRLQASQTQLQQQLLESQRERQEWQTKSENLSLELTEFQSGMKNGENVEQLHMEQAHQALLRQVQQEVEEVKQERDSLLVALQDRQQVWNQERKKADHNLQELQTDIANLNSTLQSKEIEWERKMTHLRERHVQEMTKAQEMPQQEEENDKNATQILHLLQELRSAQEVTHEIQKQLLVAEHAASSSNEIRRTLEEELKELKHDQERLQLVLRDRQARIDTLKGRLDALDIERANVNDQVFTTSQLTADTPAQSPARPGFNPNSPSADSVVSSFTLVMDDSGTNTTATQLQKAQRMEAQLKDQLQELESATPSKPGDVPSASTAVILDVEKLKWQNERAVKTIKALSKELLGLEEKYRKLGTKHDKLRTIWKLVETKHKALLKEHQLQQQQQGPNGDRILSTSSGSKSSGSAEHVGGPLSSISTSRSNLASTNNTTAHAHDGSALVTRSDVPQELVKSARLSHSSYQSNIARYVVRRPFLNQDEISPSEMTYFDETTVPACAPVAMYARQAHVQDPSSIEVVALIDADHSRLYLTHHFKTGLAQVAHRKRDGSWIDFGFLDARTEPFGWVSFVPPLPGDLSITRPTGGGVPVQYSLDDILEEALIYREHYCQAVLMNAWHPTTMVHVLQRLASMTQWTFLEPWAYWYGSTALLGPSTTAGLVFQGQSPIALLVLFMAIGIATASMPIVKK